MLTQNNSDLLEPTRPRVISLRSCQLDQCFNW